LTGITTEIRIIQTRRSRASNPRAFPLDRLNSRHRLFGPVRAPYTDALPPATGPDEKALILWRTK
jgi:hypothetical protein